MLEACLPLGPCTTSKETFWPSLRDLKPLMLIAEKCANRSSLPSSGVMKPKPFASLNHLTVPFAMSYFLTKKTGGFPSNCLKSKTAHGETSTADTLTQTPIHFLPHLNL